MRLVGRRHLTGQVRVPVPGRQLVQTHHAGTVTLAHDTRALR
jgi:hypothetical protein